MTSPMIQVIRKANRRERRNQATLRFLQEIVLPLTVLYTIFHFLYYVSVTVQ